MGKGVGNGGEVMGVVGIKTVAIGVMAADNTSGGKSPKDASGVAAIHTVCLRRTHRPHLHQQTHQHRPSNNTSDHRTTSQRREITHWAAPPNSEMNAPSHLRLAHMPNDAITVAQCRTELNTLFFNFWTRYFSGLCNK